MRIMFVFISYLPVIMTPKKYEFTNEEIKKIKSTLISWFDLNKRDLLWRFPSGSCNDKNKHAYAVWVSEVMLQQTRVAVVTDYYQRWMKKWPDLQSLSKACEDDVNQMWSGLGYYSRGRRLLQGAQKVVNELNEQIPSDCKTLMKELPGVGRYTACAISSIAFDETVGVVDGNVTRVLCRMRAIGGDSMSKQVVSHLWNLSDTLVDHKRPGDFNQAMMELGATVCLPKNPFCKACPVRFACKAYEEVEYNHRKYRKNYTSEQSEEKVSTKIGNEISEMKEYKKDIAEVQIENCADPLALPSWDPWISELGVTNYPRKSKKKPPRIEDVFVTVIEAVKMDEVALLDKSSSEKSKFLALKRPSSGLLAGLWEFPNQATKNNGLTKKSDKKRKFSDKLKTQDHTLSLELRKSLKQHTDELLKLIDTTKVRVLSRNYVGEVEHVFSHILQTNYIEHVRIVSGDKREMTVSGSSPHKWVYPCEFKQLAISSATLKILNCILNLDQTSSAVSENSKKKLRQSNMHAYFTKSN